MRKLHRIVKFLACLDKFSYIAIERINNYFELPGSSQGQTRFSIHEDGFVDDGVSSLSQRQLRMNCESQTGCWFRDQLDGNSKGA